MNPKAGLFTFLLGLAGIGLVTTVVVASTSASAKATADRQGSPQRTSAVRAQAPKAPSGPVRTRFNTPPLPTVGYAPVRPMDVEAITASVRKTIRAAIERRGAPGNAAGRTPTPAPPSKK